MIQDIDITHIIPAECIQLADHLSEQAVLYAEAVPVTPAQGEELNRRLNALDAGTMEPGEPWKGVRERLGDDESSRHHHAGD